MDLWRVKRPHDFGNDRTIARRLSYQKRRKIHVEAGLRKADFLDRAAGGCGGGQ